MSDGKANIVPFGKYKGRLIEEVLIDDPQYMQWLSGQDWFRSRFAVLHQVIINRGSEPEETPEHNALQVQFLDDDFCLRFMRHLIPDYETQALKWFNDARASNLELVLEKIEKEKGAPQEADDELVRQLKFIERYDESVRDQQRAWAHKTCEDRRAKHVKRLPHLQRIAASLSPSITKTTFQIARQFETRGIDVALEISADIQWRRWVEYNAAGEPCDGYWEWGRRWRGSAHWSESFAIEIKPAVGDDYPAVLRQMKANGSRYLFVGQYTGRGASREQFIKTFATAAIQVVFADQV